MVNFKPYEQNQLEALLSSGLARQDPTTAYQIFSGLQQGALQRQAERQAMNQQMMQEAIGGLQQYAMTPGVDPSGLDALVGSYQAMNPALAKPKFDQNLDQAVSSLQPLIQGSPSGGMTGEDAANVAASAQNAVAQGMDLHSARMAYMQVFRYSNPDPAAQQQAFDLFGQQYVAAGGDPGGTEVTRPLAPAAGTAPTPGAPLPAGQKVLSTLDTLLPQVGGQVTRGSQQSDQQMINSGMGMGTGMSNGLEDILARLRLAGVLQ